MTHLRPEELSAALDGALQGPSHETVERHLAECARCRDALAALGEQEASLRPLLEHDPGEAYFESFAARVEDRIRAAGLKGAQSRLGREGPWSWLSSPRRLAWAGAMAAVLGGAALVLLTSRPERSMLQRPEILDRAQPRVEAVSPEAKQEPSAPEPTLAKKDARPLAEGARRPETAADELRQQASREEGNESRATLEREAATAPSEARGLAPNAVSPQRAKEVRRTASGEDVPVQGQAAPFAAPPPATGGAADLKLAKPRAAQPMAQQAPSASNLRSLDKDGSVSLCGRVVDARQRPVAGAIVAIADRGLVTTAGSDGRFCLAASAGLHDLSVMAVGYQPERLQVRVEGESSEALVTLRSVTVLEPPIGSLDRAGRSGEVGIQGGFSSEVGRGGSRLADQATALSARAESLQSAALFDRAAGTWSKVVASTRDAVQLDARYRLAEARFRAWQLAPTPARTGAARTAFKAFLGAVKSGPRRDQVLRWRTQLDGGRPENP